MDNEIYSSGIHSSVIEHHHHSMMIPAWSGRMSSMC